MKTATTLKTLMLTAIAGLTFASGASHADFGRPGPEAAPYNPWLAPTYYQQAQQQAALKEQLARFEQRQDQQLERILTGMEKGRLTMYEATALLREHTAINALERKYLADGRLGPRELRELEDRLAQAGEHIRYEANDGERQGMRPLPQRSADSGHRGR